VIVTCLFLLEVMIYWRLWSAEPDDLVEASDGQP
jgi:hypothetical protein